MYFSNFLKDQVFIIKEKGIKILIYKITKLFVLLPVLLIALTLYIFILSLSPILRVRFLSLSFERIGRIYPLAWYLKLKNAGEFQHLKCLDLSFIKNKSNHNKVWLKLWKREIKILPFSILWKQVLFINTFFKNRFKHEILDYNSGLHDQISAKKNPHIIKSIKEDSFKKIILDNRKLINLDKKEIEDGKKYLTNIGISENRFICFHARDSAYLSQYDSSFNWSYHNFRDCDIETYSIAIKNLTNKSLFCLRMGSKVLNKISYANSKIIDYANSKEQSDLLDIYLASKCYFAIYSDAGLAAIPEMFGKPIVFVNWPALNFPTYNHNSLLIPKKIYSKKDKQLLPFKDSLQLQFNSKTWEKDLKDLDLVLLDNTAEEISEVSLEMESKLKNNHNLSKEDEILQEKFWNLINHKFIKSPSFRIGSEFLRKNKNLLN